VESEDIVQHGLDALMRGRTSFVIAHRLSTIRGADRILVLEGGKVIENGSHQDLVTQKGHYANIVHAQARSS
jgi:ABC-type multidrug transport system fused ATPase/permease subunit